MLLFGVAGVSLAWMHLSILRLNRQRHPELKDDTDLPEIMQAVAAAEQARVAADAAAKAAMAAAEAARRASRNPR